MRTIVYTLLFALVFLVVKAMFIDDYLKKIRSENSASIENNISAANNSQTKTTENKPISPVTAESTTRAEGNENNDSHLTPRQKFEKETQQSFIDRMIDKLANKLAEKLPPTQD